MFVSNLERRSLNFGIILTLTIATLNITSCSNKVDESQEPLTELRFGAVYISCESAPWQFHFSGLLGCEQEELAPLELNPNNACSMSDIQTSDGEIIVSFSDNLNIGRLKINSNSEVTMQDADGNEAVALYLNDYEFIFLSKNGIRLKLSIVNVYVGNCFHELIRWEELNP